MTELQVNKTWLRGVANCLEQNGEFKLAPHDVVRLREIVDQLGDAETAPTVHPQPPRGSKEFRDGKRITGSKSVR